MEDEHDESMSDNTPNKKNVLITVILKIVTVVLVLIAITVIAMTGLRIFDSMFNIEVNSSIDLIDMFY